MSAAGKKQLPDVGLPAVRVAPPTLNRLWQLPVFALGVAALVLALRNLPQPRTTSFELVERHLAEGFEALDAGDAESAVDHGKQALLHVDAAPQRAGDLRLLIGSAHLLEARSADHETRLESARRARVYLQQAEQLGVSDPFKPRLQFRLALVKHCVGLGADEIIPELETALRYSPADRQEGYWLLSDLCLEKSPPDLEAALRACEKLAALPGSSQANQARLRQAELLLRLKRPEAARQALAQVAPTAPESPRALHLRALSFFEERDWSSAVALWEGPELEKLPALAAVLYYRGLAYDRLDKPDEARQAWSRLQAERPDSAEALAAGLRLADLDRAQGRDVEALAGFETLLTKIEPAYRGPHLDEAAVRAMVESAWSAWLKQGRFEEARRLAAAARRLSAPGEAEQRFALASEAAGLEAFQQANDAAGADADRLVALGRQRCLEAAEAFETVARLRRGAPEHAELLWSSAANFLRAQQYTRAAAVLERYLALDIPQKRRLEALVGLGEAQQALKQNQKAIQLLKQALSQDTPLSFRTRYLLALAQMEEGKFEDAERTLRENLNAAAPSPEPAEFSQSLFAMGHLLYRKRQYLEAAAHLERAVEKYPRDPQALQARYVLAECYRRAAGAEAKTVGKAEVQTIRELYQKQYAYKLEQALTHFRHVAFALSDRQEKQPLNAEEQVLLRESRFGVGECLFNLGNYQEATGVYEALAESYRDRAESLTALMHVTRCYFTLKRGTEAKNAVQRARTVLDELGDKELQATQISRKDWQDWLDAAGRGFR